MIVINIINCFKVLHKLSDVVICYCVVGVKSGQMAGFDDVVNNNANSASAANPARGIELMSYTDFLSNLSARGIPAPQRVTVRRDPGQAPRYVVHQHHQQRAQVRNLRRHGYDSENGYVTGRQAPSHGYESDRSYCNGHPQGATSRHGYDSDVGYRSDVTGCRGNRAVSHRPNRRPNSSDFPSESYGRNRDVFRSDHDVPSARSNQYIVSRNLIPSDRGVQEPIREEDADLIGHAPLWTKNRGDGNGRGANRHRRDNYYSQSEYRSHVNPRDVFVSPPHDIGRTRVPSSRRQKIESCKL